MQKSSWIVLGLCIVLAALLGFGYSMSRSAPEPMTMEKAQALLNALEQGIEKKNVAGLMRHAVNEKETRIANLTYDQLQLMLARGFRNAGKLNADLGKPELLNGNKQASLSFDLSVTEAAPGLSSGEIYRGRVRLVLEPKEINHFFGLYKTYDWKVTGADHDGRPLESIGDY